MKIVIGLIAFMAAVSSLKTKGYSGQTLYGLMTMDIYGFRQAS